MTRTPRPSRVLAVARRDLRLELGHRRGFALPLIMGLLLVPASTVRYRPASEIRTLFVSGDVPDEVAALPNVQTKRGRAHLAFGRMPDAPVPIVIRAQAIPKEIRQVLEPDPPVRFVDLRPEAKTPYRSLLLGLISASVLTGAVAETLPGERSRKTLEILLASAITRAELVLGKWLAWAGFGIACGALAIAASVATGRLVPGPWLLPVPFLPGCTVALGMYMVRRSADVVGGSTVTVRVLPAVLSIGGIAAWALSTFDPMAAAAFPLGGALYTSGANDTTWSHAIVASASTGLATTLLLWRTVRDLEAEGPQRPAGEATPLQILATITLAAGSWWLAIAGPVLWAAAGNARISDGLSRASGVWAGAAMLGIAGAVALGRARDPARALALGLPRGSAWTLGAATGIALSAAAGVGWALPFPDEPWWHEAHVRFGEALVPRFAGPIALALVVLSEEALFRGWLQRASGPALALAAWVLVAHPLDPLAALAVGAPLATLSWRTGSIWPCVLARFVWAATPALDLPTVAALLAAAVPTALLVIAPRRA